jgi:hypothetical protein
MEALVSDSITLGFELPVNFAHTLGGDAPHIFGMSTVIVHITGVIATAVIADLQSPVAGNL